MTNKYVYKLFERILLNQPTQTIHIPQKSISIYRTPEEWSQYWQTRGFSWRTEPEIERERQAKLSQCRALIPDIERGIYPFKGMKLSRADAARFTYQGQTLQRKIRWHERAFGRWFFSLFLALLTGYGYHMWRIIMAYLLIIALCTAAYFSIGIYYPPHLTLLQAFLESVTAFHGRVFYELFTPDTPQIWVTALEAIAGLVLESVFIAMLTQRFFGK
ncbi:hypothetical protein KDA_68610 [Dictyobacter alpinus]|uniref:Uncharacterized protein n=1 Tax=Dictyobacter alpinus TaxID=2014873 RepID=A0A402BJ91_9CHLR|nr:hypothetical protein [Dictyobacter alpinus]GCE31377.1 hypothetical protein KDA_68610 [Dictyobacter alpinus]